MDGYLTWMSPMSIDGLFFIRGLGFDASDIAVAGIIASILVSLSLVIESCLEL